MNLDELKQIQKIATQAMNLINKYAPEPEDEEDWESDEDSDEYYNDDGEYYDDE